MYGVIQWIVIYPIDIAIRWTNHNPRDKYYNNLWDYLVYLIYAWAIYSIAHETEGRMGYWLRSNEGERNNCFSKIQLIGQKSIETKYLSLVKARL